MKHRISLLCTGYCPQGVDDVTGRPSIVLTYVNGNSVDFLHELVGSDRIVDIVSRFVTVEVTLEDDVDSPFDVVSETPMEENDKTT